MTSRSELRAGTGYVIFGVGIGNLGRTGGRRVPMGDLVAKINERLRAESYTARIASSFGHTGNFATTLEDSHDGGIVTELRSCLGFEAAILPIADVIAAIGKVSSSRAPAREAGFRWTPGMALHVSGPLSDAAVKPTDRAILWRISPTHAGIWKRDVETSDGKLNRDNRGGGWGALADEISEQVGGRWTARSLRTVIGVARRAEGLI